MITTHRCNFEALQPYVKEAKAAGILFIPTTTYWLAATETGEITGFGGLSIKSNYAISKSLYVLPAHRRKGIGKKLINDQLVFLKLNGYKRMIANCLPASLDLYLSFGAKVITEYKAATKVEIIL